VTLMTSDTAAATQSEFPVGHLLTATVASRSLHQRSANVADSSPAGRSIVRRRTHDCEAVGETRRYRVVEGLAPLERRRRVRLREGRGRSRARAQDPAGVEADKANGIREVWIAADLAQRGAHPAAAFGLDVVDGFYTGGGHDVLVKASSTKGGHGFGPDRTALHSSFILTGPALQRRGNIGVIRMTQIRADAGADSQRRSVADRGQTAGARSRRRDFLLAVGRRRRG
jgi:hypothetical protein